MSERRLEAVAEAIHDADYAHEPWKSFASLHDDDKDHYRRMAEAALNALQLTEECGYKLDDDGDGPDAWFPAAEYNTSRPVSHRRFVTPWSVEEHNQ